MDYQLSDQYKKNTTATKNKKDNNTFIEKLSSYKYSY